MLWISAEYPGDDSIPNLWAEHWALLGSSGGWQDRESPGAMAVAAASFPLIMTTKGVWNTSWS